jgi:organic radical activating enzyme
MTHAIRHLEMHVVHSCNFTCEGCSHYSNQHHKGIISIAEADSWMQKWSHKLAPATFSLVGGEPSIHPQLTEMLSLTRRHWPKAHIRLVTNGTLLHKHVNLPQLIKEDKNIAIYLSLHHDSPEYVNKMEPVRLLLEEWIKSYNTPIEVYESYKYWTRRYHGFGHDMEPFTDQHPRASWESCPAKYCPQLFDDKIWKCAPLAYLTLQDEKYGLSTSWEPYLAYKPLIPDSSDSEIKEFFMREDETVCSMCPAKPEKFPLPLPLIASSR